MISIIEYLQQPAQFGDYKLWIISTTIFMAYWFLLYGVATCLAQRCSSVYRGLATDSLRAEFCQYATSFIHSNSSVVLVFLCIYSICGTDPETDQRLTVWNSDQCFMTATNLHVLTMFHTSTYFVLDMTISLVGVKRNNLLDKQTYLHHILGFTSFYFALYFMGYIVVTCVLLLMTEMTSTYITLRWYFYTYQLEGRFYAKLNTGLISILFFIIRILYYIFIVFGRARKSYFQTWGTGQMPNYQYEALDVEQEKIGPVGYIFLFECSVTVVLGLVANSLWMYLIFKQVRRMVYRSVGWSTASTAVSNSDEGYHQAKKLGRSASFSQGGPENQSNISTFEINDMTEDEDSDKFSQKSSRTV